MADERISWFPVLEDDELEEPERKLFAKAAAVIGFVPNVFRTYAWRPERFRAWFAHFKTVMEGTEGLSAREREMISVAVSMANGCLYCLVAHGAALREASDDKVEADRITLDYRRADLTRALQATHDRARRQRPPAAARARASRRRRRPRAPSRQTQRRVAERHRGTPPPAEVRREGHGLLFPRRRDDPQDQDPRAH